MRARTVRGSEFTILFEGKRVVVKHVVGKGKRCRVTIPDGVTITSSDPACLIDDEEGEMDFKSNHSPDSSRR